MWLRIADPLFKYITSRGITRKCNGRVVCNRKGVQENIDAIRDLVEAMDSMYRRKNSAGVDRHSYSDGTESFEHKMKPLLPYEPRTNERHSSADQQPARTKRLSRLTPDSTDTKPRKVKQKRSQVNVDRLKKVLSEDDTLLQEQRVDAERHPVSSPNAVSHNQDVENSSNSARGNFFTSDEVMEPTSPMPTGCATPNAESGDATIGRDVSQHQIVERGTVLVKTTLKRTKDGELPHQQDIPGEVLSYFVLEEGGWGWVVCFASFCANFIVFGLMASFRELESYINKSYFNASENTSKCFAADIVYCK